MARLTFPDVPDHVLAEARSIARRLPETSEVRTTVGVEIKIRRSTFAYVFAIDDPDRGVVPMIVVRADPAEREALLAGGHPYFATGSGRDRLGIVIDDSTDWDEIAELMTESYRLLAPKKLIRDLHLPG